jgi:hypothetical protein
MFRSATNVLGNALATGGRDSEEKNNEIDIVSCRLE